MEGTFPCKTCEGNGENAKFFYDTYDIVWWCTAGHFNVVNIYQERGY